jgi:hypothetical protein
VTLIFPQNRLFGLQFPARSIHKILAKLTSIPFQPRKSARIITPDHKSCQVYFDFILYFFTPSEWNIFTNNHIFRLFLQQSQVQTTTAW